MSVCIYPYSYIIFTHEYLFNYNDKITIIVNNYIPERYPIAIYSYTTFCNLYTEYGTNLPMLFGKFCR